MCKKTLRPERGWIVRSHIVEERNSTNEDVGPEGSGLQDYTSVGKGTKPSF